ncbi:MAG: flagellar basal body L-ring protein FlgH [Rhodobacteraceae bacterium]|nr:flagellar basal body L-ring protein FlgH [Paracoccaceae bacterium]
MRLLYLLPLLLVAACSPQRLEEIGQTPQMSPPQMSPEHTAMMTPGLPISAETPRAPAAVTPASLWTGNRGSLLGDRRALVRGDILTVVIEINDSAQISNSTARSRSGQQDLGIGALFGVPEYLEGRLPGGASLDTAVQLDSSSGFSGDGSVRRNEQLTLRIAATVLSVQPNGVLAISGLQEVRVNNEIRELMVTGFVRPADISRQNEITYDKIASARISYGGRGLISDMQRPRYGQQAAELLLPF